VERKPREGLHTINDYYQLIRNSRRGTLYDPFQSFTINKTQGNPAKEEMLIHKFET